MNSPLDTQKVDFSILFLNHLEDLQLEDLEKFYGVPQSEMVASGLVLVETASFWHWAFVEEHLMFYLKTEPLDLPRFGMILNPAAPSFQQQGMIREQHEQNYFQREEI